MREQFREWEVEQDRIAAAIEVSNSEVSKAAVLALERSTKIKQAIDDYEKPKPQAVKDGSWQDRYDDSNGSPEPDCGCLDLPMVRFKDQRRFAKRFIDNIEALSSEIQSSTAACGDPKYSMAKKIESNLLTCAELQAMAVMLIETIDANIKTINDVLAYKKSRVRQIKHQRMIDASKRFQEAFGAEKSNVRHERKAGAGWGNLYTAMRGLASKTAGPISRVVQVVFPVVMLAIYLWYCYERTSSASVAVRILDMVLGAVIILPIIMAVSFAVVFLIDAIFSTGIYIKNGTMPRYGWWGSFNDKNTAIAAFVIGTTLMVATIVRGLFFA